MYLFFSPEEEEENKSQPLGKVNTINIILCFQMISRNYRKTVFWSNSLKPLVWPSTADASGLMIYLGSLELNTCACVEVSTSSNKI